jgi:hypothetical protein
MATKKRRKTTTLKTLERRIANMSHRKRRTTKRRRKPTTLSAGFRKHTVHRRRRKKSFLHDRGGVIPAIKTNAAGALGGVSVLLIEKLPTNKWIKLGLAVAASIGATMWNKPNIGSGIAGATAYSAAKEIFPSFLSDNLEDTQYVDPSTLSDSGFVDENGNAVVQDGDGVMYALNDSGELVAVGDAYALSEGMTDVSMVPLQDAYALNDPYALSAGRFTF